MTRLEKFLELSYLARIGTLTHHGHIELQRKKNVFKNLRSVSVYECCSVRSEKNMRSAVTISKLKTAKLVKNK